jgi:hypothetical protein
MNGENVTHMMTGGQGFVNGDLICIHPQDEIKSCEGRKRRKVNGAHTQPPRLIIQTLNIIALQVQEISSIISFSIVPLTRLAVILSTRLPILLSA